MFDRVINRVNREIRNGLRKGVPLQEQVAFREQRSNWYEPLLAGPGTFVNDCTSSATAAAVLALCKKLTADRFLSFIIDYYSAGLQRFGGKWRYADILTVLYGICSNVKIESYLEIGVRRGRSMAMVAALQPQARIVGFDLWVKNYVGIDNPGSDFVRQELAAVGYTRTVEFVSGDSRVTVPRYFRQHPREYFDLITVDGAHTRRGASVDLKNVIPRLKIGGFLVFDDICSTELSYLKGIWKKLVADSGRFLTYSFEELGYGIAFAIRRF